MVDGQGNEYVQLPHMIPLALVFDIVLSALAVNRSCLLKDSFEREL